MSPGRAAALILAALIAASSLFALSALPQGNWLVPWRIKQPIAFNHNLHIEELGFDCADCHPYALTSVRATIPNIENCLDCHEEAQTESLEEAKLVEYIAAGEKVPWRKIYRIPDHVFFSHRRHASIGAIECEVCHGRMAEQVEPAGRPFWRPTMDNCIECHEESGVSNDCLYCHT